MSARSHRFMLSSLRGTVQGGKLPSTIRTGPENKSTTGLSKPWPKHPRLGRPTPPATGGPGGRAPRGPAPVGIAVPGALVGVEASCVAWPSPGGGPDGSAPSIGLGIFHLFSSLSCWLCTPPPPRPPSPRRKRVQDVGNEVEKGEKEEGNGKEWGEEAGFGCGWGGGVIRWE